MTGEPSYVELGVPDPDLARAFYGAVLGWPTDDARGPGQVESGGLSIGIHGGDPSALFEVFFAVDDLDSAMTDVQRLGGSVLGAITDSPGFGRWVECRDDQGVRFGLRQPAD